MHDIETEKNKFKELYRDSQHEFERRLADKVSQIHNLQRQLKRSQEKNQECLNVIISKNYKNDDEYKSRGYLNRKNKEQGAKLSQQLDRVSTDNQSEIIIKAAQSNPQIWNNLNDIFQKKFVKQHNDEMHETNYSLLNLLNLRCDQLEKDMSDTLQLV